MSSRYQKQPEKKPSPPSRANNTSSKGAKGPSPPPKDSKGPKSPPKGSKPSVSNIKAPTPVPKAPVQSSRTQISKTPTKTPENMAEYAEKFNISENQVIELKAAFDLFDTDNGGSIDTKELKAAMVSLGFDSKNAVIFQMIADLDEDGSGQLEFNEWVHLMTHRVNKSSSRESLNKVFALYDDHRTGFLTMRNLKMVAEDLGETISEQELQEMIDRADTDLDGLVSEQEFYVIMTRKMKE